MADLDLIAQYRGTGDSAFVGELFERYSVQIYAICRKYFKDQDEPKETAMEVFEYLLVTPVGHQLARALAGTRHLQFLPDAHPQDAVDRRQSRRI